MSVYTGMDRTPETMVLWCNSCSSWRHLVFDEWEAAEKRKRHETAVHDVHNGPGTLAWKRLRHKLKVSKQNE